MANLRPMYMSDLLSVVRIINEHDEDDGEAAHDDYQDDGVENQFVLEVDEKIVGVTGFRPVPATDETYWLSWTYLLPDYQGKGHGKAMLTELIAGLRQNNGRKIFAKVSDYQNDEGIKVYDNAFKTYQSLNFKEEVLNNDFYDEDENQHILSLDLTDNPENSGQDNEDYQVAEEKPIIRFCGLTEIAETDGAYTFSWEVKETKKLFGKRNFSVEDLQLGISAAEEAGGRKVFLTFPSNLPLIHQPLQDAGFKYVGRLENYYEQGIHEYHFVYTIKPKML